MKVFGYGFSILAIALGVASMSLGIFGPDQFFGMAMGNRVVIAIYALGMMINGCLIWWMAKDFQ